MAIFRSARKRDYTVMSNHHLRNRGLSLKAKGLHSLMLSLPEDWDFTQRGLAAICKDGVDSIASTIRELEAAGYLRRRRIRDAHGRLSEIEYTILECPDPPQPVSSPSDTPQSPETPSPEREDPLQEVPTQDTPTSENTAQLSIQESNIQESSIHQSIIPSYSPLQEKSPRPPAARESPRRNDGKTDLLPRSMEIRNRIEYDYLITQYDQAQVDEIVELMLEVELNQSPTMKLGRDGEFPTEFIRQRFAKLNESHIELVLDNLAANTSLVHNTRAYILTALFNSISTIDSHYALLVNFDQSHR